MVINLWGLDKYDIKNTDRRKNVQLYTIQTYGQTVDIWTDGRDIRKNKFKW